MEALTSFKSIVAPVTGLVNLIERLVNAPKKRREERFDKFIRPLHDKLQEVHLNYSETLRRFKRGLPMRSGEKSWIDADHFGALGQDEALAIVEEKKARFRADREEQESVRDLLRINAKAIIEAIEDKMERRYLYALIVYFQENDHRPFQSGDFIDNQINTIIDKGGNSAMDTPTTVLLKQIRKTANPEEIEGHVTSAINSLNQRLSDAAKAYIELQKDIIKGKV